MSHKNNDEMSKCFWQFVGSILICLHVTLLNYSCTQNKTDEQALLDKATQMTDSLLVSLESTIDSIDPDFQPSMQSKLWSTLLDIEYETQGVYGYIPKFTDAHQLLDKKEVTIKGYMYPLEAYEKQTFFMLSANPLNACFFCGGSGPESAIEVNSPDGIPLKDGVVTIKGILSLNTEEPERLFYILNEAKLVKFEK